MAEEELTVEECKILTGYLGECWHEWIGGIVIGKRVDECKPETCKHCGINKYLPPYEMTIRNRTFTTWQDFGDLWEISIRQSWWPKFCKLHNRYYRLEHLINPTRFSKLLAGWLKGEGEVR